MLQNQSTDEVRYYHSSQNNNRIFERPIHVQDIYSFQTFMQHLEQKDILEWARTQRPNSAWTVQCVTNLTIFVNKVVGYPMGKVDSSTGVPDYIRNNKGLYTLQTRSWGGGIIDDNLCMFRCLAVHKAMMNGSTMLRGIPVESSAKMLFQIFADYSKNKEPIDKFQGILGFDIQHLEACFDVNINIYTLELVNKKKHRFVC